MKSLIELQQYRKCIFLFMTGILCSALAFVIYVTDPVKLIVKSNWIMKPGSIMFTLWEKPPVEVLVNVYVFNITNSEAFLRGEENLKLQEVGPYVYQEVLENQNVTWNENGTLSYYPKRTVFFRPELSIGRPEDHNVSVPNVPMLGIFSALHDSGFIVNYPFVTLANLLDSNPILNMSIYDYLWGYEDSLVQLAGSVVPNYINFQKFGILDRMYDEGDNLMNMNIKDDTDMVEEKGRYLSIESLNGNPGLPQWGYVQQDGNETIPENTRCNSLQGATEGTLFPAFMNPNASFRVYRKVFCRPIPITFTREVETDGLPGYLYNIQEDFADPPSQNPENECYCRKPECLRKGLMDLTPCYYNIPTAASLPHFLNADPTISDGIEGLNPDLEKHSSSVILQPDFGIPMRVHSRIQTNLVMRKTYYNSKITPFNDLTVPLFWSDLEIPRLPSESMQLLRFSLITGPLTQNILLVVLTTIGIICLCWSLARALSVVNDKQQLDDANVDSCNHRRDSSDMRIPLGCRQYTSIKILPKIKKISSKTDLFS